LVGRRVGLIVHAASVTQEGKHAIDVLRDSGVKVVRIFSPEHGLRGRAAAGERVESAKDPVSNLPVVSLYGAERKPRPEDLSDLDTLVFDLQGAGVRFYTYVSTLILAIEAAAESEIDFVVLDRPNPLGGNRIEGPLSAPRSIVPQSFINVAPGPLVHGLTLGEMARFVNSRLQSSAHLEVIPMRGWVRSMTWEDTGRTWTAPSPNLRSAEAAIVYPGTAMLEATNVSEGRGTPAPFLILGAPWLDSSRLQVIVPGFELTAAKFKTVASAAALSPKYLGEECSGVRVRVTDPTIAEPYRLGLELVSRLSQQTGFEWKNSGANLTRLLGTHRVFEMLSNESSVQDILDADRADHAAWREMRRAALLYD
jgi:beta-N-acetylhexosaminidase